MSHVKRAPSARITSHPAVRKAHKQKQLLIQAGLCGPCAFAMSQRGFTGQPELCPDCAALPKEEDPDARTRP